MNGYLNLNLPQWKRLLISRIVAIIPALIILLIFNEQYNSLDDNLNILQSIQLPFAIIPLVTIASNKKIMGEDFVLSKFYSYLIWTIGIILMILNMYQLYPRNSNS